MFRGFVPVDAAVVGPHDAVRNPHRRHPLVAVLRRDDEGVGFVGRRGAPRRIRYRGQVVPVLTVVVADVDISPHRHVEDVLVERVERDRAPPRDRAHVERVHPRTAGQRSRRHGPRRPAVGRPHHSPQPTARRPPVPPHEVQVRDLPLQPVLLEAPAVPPAHAPPQRLRRPPAPPPPSAAPPFPRSPPPSASCLPATPSAAGSACHSPPPPPTSLPGPRSAIPARCPPPPQCSSPTPPRPAVACRRAACGSTPRPRSPSDRAIRSRRPRPHPARRVSTPR